MFLAFSISCLVLLIGGVYYLIYNFKKINTDFIKNETADDYLIAKKIFVRDPESFKDKDQDGIDDIIDKNIK